MKATIQLTALLLVITSAPISFSCQDDNDETPKAKSKTKTELLTARPWKHIARISGPAYYWNENAILDDVLTTMPSCEKDNFDLYQTNGIKVTDEGPTQCDDLGQQSWTATWAFADNEREIIMNGSDHYTIVELTAVILKLTRTFEEDGVTYKQIETYSP
jgi:hypothetical protein